MIQKKNKGISLIVLIITIVVIIILGTAIIVNIAKTNIIDNANEAILKQDLKVLEEELSLYAQNKYLETKGKFDITKLNATKDSVTYTGEGTIEETNIYEILTSLEGSKYNDRITIVDGKIVIDGQSIGGNDETTHVGGLYNENDELIVSWDDLVNTYGMDITKNYTSTTYKTDTSSPYYIFTTNNLSGKLIIDDGVTEIGEYAFRGCSSLTSIAIPEGVTSIGDSTFYNCESLENIQLPSSLKYIRSEAFYNSGITDLYIPVGVSYIDETAFNMCIFLKTINVNENNTSYDSRDNCNAIITKSTNSLVLGCKGTIIPTSVTEIGAYAFCGSGIKSISIPANIGIIDGFAFYNCFLENLEISEGVFEIRNYAFYNCRSLSSVIIPESVITVGEGAFSYCTNLTSIKFPSNLTIIPAEIFRDCTNLTDVTIPESVTSIGDYAFYNCRSLTITVPDTVQTIGTEAFFCIQFLYYTGSATGHPWGASSY